jgi:hypothetical protein
MSNSFYNHGAFPSTGSAATSASMRAELDLVAAGFDKMPTLSGNANKFVVVNSTGTALTQTSTLPSFTVTDTDFTVQDDGDNTRKFQFNAGTVTPGATRIYSVPDANTTLVGTDTTQTLTNKTLTAPVISSIVNTGSLSLPTSTDTLVGRATTDTLTNKTLTSPVIGTIVNTGTLTLPTSTDTLVGRATTDTLTNKTLTSPVIGTIVNTGTLTLPTSTDTLVGRATTDTLTNKTLTSPVIGTIVNTGTLTLPTSTDTLVGRATTDTLTNKTLTSPVIGTIVNTGTLTLPTSTDTLVGRATTDTLTNKTLGAFTISGTVSGGGNQINNVIIGTSNPLAGTFTDLSTTGLVRIPSANRSAAAALTPTNPAFLYGVASTYTDTSSSGPLTPIATFYSLAQPTLSTSNVTTYATAATLYLANAPVAGGSATITNAYSLYVAAGASYFGGAVTFASSVGALTVSALTNTGLTSGRVPYSTTAGLQTDSANLTFNGTTLTANTIGAFTLGGTVAGGGNQINNIIIGTTNPLAGAFTTITASTSITNSGLTSGRVPYSTTAGLQTDSANLTFNGTTLTANTIGAFTLGGTVAGGGNQINNVIIGTTNPLAGAFTTLSTTGNITNSNAAGRLDFTGGSSAQVWATASSLYLDASAGQSVIIRPNNQVTAGTFSSTGLAVTGTLTATSTLASATAIVNTTNVNGTFLQIQLSGTPKTYLGSSVAISGVGTSSDTDTFATGKLRLFGDNQVTNYATVSSTGLAVTGTLTLSSATSGTIASFKSTGAYGTVAADNTGTTGGGSFSVRQNGTQYGAFSVDGAIQGNTSSDVAVFADTGSSLKFYTNGSGTVKASISTAGLFTVAAGASIQGLTVGLGNGSASATSTAVGISALANSTGTDATAFGYFAGENLSSGAFSIAIGSRAMGGTTGGPNTGSYNTAIGNSALAQNTSGNRNIAIGNEALSANQTGVGNVAVGSYQPSGGDAVLGVNTAGNYNTAVGSAALAKNTASSNTAVGYTAAYSNISGTSNVAFGASALYQNTTSSNNTAIGANALANITGSSNTGVGQGVMYNTSSGSKNTGVGDSALGNVTGSNNTAVGYQALTASSLSSSNNTAVGYQAGLGLTSGGANTFYGLLAGSNLQTGDYNLYVGFGSQAGAVSNSYEMVICTTNTSASGKGSSTGFISAGGAGGIYNGANTTTWATTSDQRLKKNIVDNNVGLEKIAAIQVRNFEYRLPEEVDAELKSTDAINKAGVQLGVISQELQQVLPECVKTESSGVMSVDADNLTWYMINAIKELKAEVDSLKSQLNGA